jgi:membrane peptidoglycan carboxypeptidase
VKWAVFLDSSTLEPMSRPPEERLPKQRMFSHLSVMAAVAVVIGLLAAGLAIPFVGVLGVGTKELANSMQDFPEELETPALAQKTVILDSRGNQIASIFDENRVNVRLDQISRIMVASIVAIEDYRFYEHGAIDLKGTLRALLKNKAAGGVAVQGGSSITQQTVKLTLLAKAGDDPEKIAAATENSYARKVKELRYGIALEEKHTKDWILERYLNIAYFGDGVYGIQAAARHYFDVNARKLNLAQSAMLAGLVKNPVGYDPTNYPDKAIGRRNVVLDRMAELNVITEAERDEAKGTGLDLKLTRTKNGCVESPAAFFCDYVMSYLMADETLGATEEDREKLLKSGGLTIRTTVDLRYQRAADRSVSGRVFPRDPAIGGLAMVEPGTGAVRALAQSRPMGPRKNKGETFLNYVVPRKYGDSNGFQAGSTFKAFTLAAALNRGIPLETKIKAPEPVSITQTEYEVCNGKRYSNAGQWEPTNSTGNGTFDLYSGTRLSVNTFFVQLELATGVCAPYQLAQAMGLDLAKKDRAAELTPSFTLGTVDVSPLEMAEAYATFAARGLHCDSTPVTAIEDSDGNTIREYDPSCSQLFPEAVGDGVSAVLRGVQEGAGFGAVNGLALNKPSAGKTGTTSSAKAVWFVGYTPQLAAAAMIAGANAKGQPIPLEGLTVGGNYVSNASGSSFAGPIWGNAMRAIQDTLKWVDFVPPNLSALRSDYTRVPQVQGMTIKRATEVLHAAGFKVALGPPTDSRQATGTVANVFPAGNSSAPVGMAILITPSNGKKPPKCKAKDLQQDPLPEQCLGDQGDDDDDDDDGRGPGGFGPPGFGNND